MSNGITGPHSNLPVVVARRADEATTEPTAEQQQIAKDFPPGLVEVERSGLKLGLQIPGGALALGGAALLGISLLSRRAPGAAESRLLAAPLVLGGSLVGLGAASAIGAELLPPKKTVAVATNIPTRVRAQEIANTMPDRETKVVQDVRGKFAVVDEGPIRSGGSVDYGYQRGNGHFYGDGHFHGHHYSGDGHYHQPDYYEPYYPGTGDYYPTPYNPPSYPDYPSGGYPGGGTSGGDDYDYNPPSYPGNSGGGTSGGDDYGYNPPSYDPPSYDPPSYDPPSYDPPSYDPPSYDPPSYDSGGYGDSSSNGNPSYDDF